MKRGWAASPTDESNDASDLRVLEAVAQPVSGAIDRQAIANVLQSDDDAERRAIPVRMDDEILIHVLPTRVGAMFSRALAAAPAPAVKLLGRDPRRAAIRMSMTGIADKGIALGRSQAEANDADAFFPTSNQSGYAWHFTDELWARATSDGLRVSVLVEEWVR